MDKRHIIYSMIAFLTVLMIFITFVTLPSYFRERGPLYTKFENAQMYLNDDDYDSLSIEYDFMSGCHPSSSATELLEKRISEYCEKDKISGYLDDQISPQEGMIKYTEEYIYDLTERYKDEERRDGTMVLHVLYLDGTYREKNILGFSYDEDKIVIFKQTIKNIAKKSRNLDTEDVEGSVLVHELGHLMGLVGIGYDSEHEDPAYENHCDESAGECVMDSSVEVRVGGFSQEPPDDFCPLCQGDLAKISDMKDGLGVEEYISFGIMVSEGMIGIAGIALFGSRDEEEEKGYSVYREHYEDHFEKKRY